MARIPLSSLLPATLLALTPLLGAQNQLACDPQQVTLRPGECACVTIFTVPATVLSVVPVFDPAAVSVFPQFPIQTNLNGAATFRVCCPGTNLAGTTVSFQDLAGNYIECTVQVSCDYPPLQLGTQPDIACGSFPGPFGLQLFADPPVPATEIGAILVSLQAGSFPVSLLNPGDPRFVELDPFTFFLFRGHAGTFGAGQQVFTAPTANLPNLFVKSTLQAQGMTVELAPAFRIRRLSQPAPIRFAPTNTFCDRGTMMDAARSFMTILEDRRGLPVIAGGGNGAIFAQVATNRVEHYDPISDSFTTSPIRMTIPRSLHTATRLQNGKWLLIGGVDDFNNPTATAELYDPGTGLFTAVGSMSTPRTGHSATLLDNGTVFVAGGLHTVSADILTTLQSNLATTEIFTLDGSSCNGTFAPGPDMGRGRAGHAALPLPDGRVYMIGGIGGLLLPATWKETEFYDGVGFTDGPSMHDGRAIFPLTDISTPTQPDRYLVAGGLGSVIGFGAPTEGAEIYSYVANQPGSWSLAGTMSTSRGMQAAYRLGNKVVQIGGLRGDLINALATDTTEFFDIPSGTWSAGPPMTFPRGAFGSYVDPYGQIHIMGGASGVIANPPVVRSTDWYFW